MKILFLYLFHLLCPLALIVDVESNSTEDDKDDEEDWDDDSGRGRTAGQRRVPPNVAPLTDKVLLAAALAGPAVGAGAAILALAHQRLRL